VTTSDLAAQADALRALHRPGAPLVLRNAWDAASARALVADAAALATTSVGVAQSLGYDDGGHIPAAEAFAALARIVAAVDVPVTADCEAGYGLDPHAFVAGLLDAGAVGCNLEDTDHATGTLRDPGRTRPSSPRSSRRVGRRASMSCSTRASTCTCARHARGRPRTRTRLPRGRRRLRLPDLLPRGGGHRRLRRGRRRHQRRGASVGALHRADGRARRRTRELRRGLFHVAMKAAAGYEP
jgi:hypothetical protein